MRTVSSTGKKERISITLDSCVLERVKLMAERDDRSLSQFINRALRKITEDEDTE